MAQQYGSLGQTVPFHDSLRYKEVIERIRTNIAHLNRCVIQLESLRGQIGTLSDSRDKRNEIRKLEDRTNREVSNTKDLFLQLSNYTIPDRGLKLQAEQLKLQFQGLMNRYTQTLKNIMERISRSYKVNDGFAPSTPLINMAEDRDEGTQSSDGQNHLIQSQRSHAQTQALALQLDEENQMAQLARDTLDIQNIFQEMSNLVYCQSELVDSIENNVDGAAMNVELGSNQLRSAVRHRAARRSKAICLGAFVFSVFTIVGFALYLVYRN